MSKSDIESAVRWFSDAKQLRGPLYATVNALQDCPPAVQVLAPAATVVLFAEAIGLDPHDLIEQARRMKKDIDGAFANEWRAMDNYVHGELIK
jgi:hypothetical protein